MYDAETAGLSLQIFGKAKDVYWYLVTVLVICGLLVHWVFTIRTVLTDLWRHGSSSVSLR